MSNKTEPLAKTLFDCQCGKVYKIITCNLNGQIKERLYEMGLVPGTFLSVVKRAPLGDPLQVAVRGYYLCVRGSVAKRFVVEEQQN
ncbi:MAG: FeoA domain-containing protein [Corallococcus sp.]|nr:FeoA domain-containing protein [Corallococcus sp.]MCM1360162.1 FeoA domain-containing protein [Corallococcus sp.]MCM1395759.1 FeoA domain-containing protein [Corallococcus sp.]